MKNFLCFVFALSAVALWAAQADMETIRQSRLFDIDYRQLHNELKWDAQYAKGAPEARVLHELRPRFDVEPMEAINHGVMVGEGCASLRYKSKDNLNPQQGSIEILFENTQWDWDNGEIHVLMQCLGKKSTLYIYKYGKDGCGVYIGSAEPKWSVFPRQLIRHLSGRGQNHLLVTYSPVEVKFYFNGKLIRTMKPGGGIAEWNKSFEIGPSGKFGRDGRTTISTVTTYNRPLSEKEVQVLAKYRIPKLKLSDMVAEQSETIPSSRFLKNPGHLGIEALDKDYVVSPWTPVQKENKIFSVWNRQYDFSGRDLLSQVTGGGEKIFDGGLNFFAVKDGITEKLQWADEIGMTVDGAGRKSFSRKLLSPEYLSGKVVARIEYDGDVRFDMQLAGIDKAENFYMEMAMDGRFSETIHYSATNRKTMRSVVSPDISYSNTLPSGEGVVYKNDFLTHVWLGNSRGGAQIYHDSDISFYPKDRKDCFQVVRDKDGKAVLRVLYATEKTPAKDGKLDLSFGLIATPVRPMPENWRAWNFSAQYDSFKGNRRGTHLIYWPDYWGERITLDPDPERATKKEQNAKCIERDHAENRKVIPYWNHRHIGVMYKNRRNPDEEFIRNNWGTTPQRPSNGWRDYLRVSTATGFTDYLARCVYEYKNAMGQIDGVYIDEMEPIANSDPKTNGGYDDYDGSRRYTYQVFADRDFYKRLDAVVRMQNGGVMPMNVAHCSGTHMMASLSHFPIFLTAEHLYSGYFPDNKELIPPESDRLYYYSYALPMDRVKSEFYYRPWGSVMVFLPCLKNQRDIMKKVEPTRDLLSRIMHADVLFWPLWCNSQEIYKVEDFRRKWDIGSKAVKFIPYWENREVTSATPDSCISYYDKNGEKLAIVSNLARVAQEMVVDLPAGTREVINAETDEKLPVSGNQVKIQMKRNDYCALIIKK